MSVRQVVALFYVLSVLAACVAVVAAVWLRARYALALYAVILVAVWTVFARKGMIAPQKPDNHPPADDAP